MSFYVVLHDAAVKGLSYVSTNSCMYIAHARDLVRHAYIRLESERGGFVYEIKTLRSNLAPEEGGRGVYSRGAYI